MGRVPMLIMMVAAAGVTYGWQPGSNGDDDSSIQYIIQVSPQQPSDGLERHDRVRSLKPDPQAGGLSLPPSLKQFGNSAREATAKQFDKAGRELKNHARDQFNNALGGVAGNGQARPTDRNLIAPPSTRLRPGGSSNNAFSPSRPTTFSTPSFPSGNANSNLTSNQRNAQEGFARSQTNGPSTAPAQRTKSWNGFAKNTGGQVATASGSNTSGRLSGGPTTSDRSPLSSTGLSASDQFGRTPGMPSHGNLFRTAADTMQNREGQAMTQFEQVQLDRRRQTQAREPGTVRSQTTDHARNPSSVFATGSPNRPAQPQLDLRLTASQIAAGGVGFDLSGRLLNWDQQVIRDPESTRRHQHDDLQHDVATQTRDTQRLDTQRLGSIYEQPDHPAQSRPQTRHESIASNDRHLEQRDLRSEALGSRFRDDRASDEARDADRRHSRSETFDRRDSRYEERQSDASYDSIARADRLERESRARFDRAESRDDRDARYSDSGLYARSDRRRQRPLAPPEPQSPSNQILTKPVVQTAQIIPNVMQTSVSIPSRKLQSSPRFTWLLMISIFVNLYFLYWLHNLRQRFRSLAAAKRMVDSTATAG